MDIADECLEETGKNQLEKPCPALPSVNGMEHIIPQMIVTLAEDNAEEKNGVCQASTAEELCANVSSNVSSRKETENVSSAEDVQSQRFKDVEKQSSADRNEEEERNTMDAVETKTTDPVAHSIAQRPLRIESEKFASSPSVLESDAAFPGSQVSEITITTMQRPLIFNGSHTQVDTLANPLEDLSQHLVKEANSTEFQPKSVPDTNLKTDYGLPQYSVETENFSEQDPEYKEKITEYISPEKALEDGKTDPSCSKKDNLHSMKKFFNSFLHETPSSKSHSEESDLKENKVEKKSLKKLFNSQKTDPVTNAKTVDAPPKFKSDPKDQTKESKYNIKKMFDSFKEDLSDKTVDKKKTDSKQCDKKADLSKTSQKDKSGIQKFFDSFKSEDNMEHTNEIPTENIETDTCIKSPIIIPQNQEQQRVPSSFTDDLSNSKITVLDKKIDSKESYKKTDKSHHKDKSGLQKFFESFKSDGISEPSTEKSVLKGEEEVCVKSPVVSSQNEELQRMPDTVKDDLSSVSDKQIGSKKADIKKTDIAKSHQKEKSGIHKFFDTFKHEESSEVSHPKEDVCIKTPLVIPQKEELPIISDPSTSEKTVVDSNIPQLQSPSNADELKHRKQDDSSSAMKKFFDSFKTEVVKVPSEEPIKKNAVKKSHSFKETLLSGGDDKKEHSNMKNVRKFFDSFKSDSSKAPEISKNIKEIDVVTLKRSQSFKETGKIADSSHSFKKFMDSLTHKKTSSHISNSESTDHVYDVVEKTNIPIKTLAAVDSKSSVKDKESKVNKDQTNTKNLFSSFHLKDSSSKQSTSVVPKKVRMSDEVCIEGSVTPSYSKEKEAPPKILNKDNKGSAEKESVKSGKKTVTKLPTIKVSDSSTVPDGAKSSMFDSFSDNFSALKGKLFQPKEEKKTKLSEQDIKTEMYDLQQAAEIDRQNETTGTYKPISDSYFDPKNTANTRETEHVIDTNIQNKTLQNAQTPPQNINIKTQKIESNPNSVSTQPRSPETLYDTCCFKLAILFSNKALEIVSDKGKAPPKKPPKPTPEAIAKARAKVVAQRLKEMHGKGQSIGENIPVGYDGIRFADDETESSCDYKDVDNFDYIMDYELINRYKFDSKVDTFSDPSTCSGSYYTAETVTLKDEVFSDAPLETISLGSHDSALFQHLGPSTSEIKAPPLQVKNKNQVANQYPAGKTYTGGSSKMSPVGETPKLKSNTPIKRVPPPLPPKPIITKHKSQKESASTTVGENSLPSQCINGLSLSPRMKSKLSKDTAATKNRPLLVADLKETEFVNLQKHDAKQSRKFNMVLKNESLNKISTISSSHKPLAGAKSLPGVLDVKTGSNSLSIKTSPQRPPLPLTLVRSHEKDVKKQKIAPQIPEKPKRGTFASEKRTISPPRPPPPITVKCTSPPPRPPPPLSGLHASDKSTVSQGFVDQDNFPTLENKKELISTNSVIIPPETSLINQLPYEEKHLERVVIDNSMLSDLNTSNYVFTSKPSDLAMYEDPSNITCNLDEEIKATEVNSNVNNNVFFEQAPIEEMVKVFTPKPPPRTRRIRSRTVEIVKAEKISEPSLRRSQSLSEIDVEKRIEHLHTPSERIDLKHLYTSVNKNGKKSSLNQSHSSSLEKLSGRPLPAPPPPPRKFRSLERRHKDEEEKPIVEKFETVDFSDLPQDVKTNSLIHPPARKKNSGKQRFHSLEHDHSQKNLEKSVNDSKMSRSHSVPIRPNRRRKPLNMEYDENANVAFPVQVEVHHTDVILDECGNEIPNPNIPSHDAVDSLSFAKLNEKITSFNSKKAPKVKSHSSWYDERQGSSDWEIIDWNASDEVEHKTKPNPKSQPTRRQSDPGKGTKRTSTFYVDVKTKSNFLPHVDKETSPLPLDHSEKSVQTSLETLSHGVTSLDEDDDTDELLNLAQTLQNELKVIINRHKSTSDVADDSTSTPVLSASESEEKNVKHELRAAKLKNSSVQSSNSELWPLTSSEESENEMHPQGLENLTEIAKKRKEKKIFYIAQEIMTSERVFVDTLKLLSVDFKTAVEAANQQRGASVVPDEVLSQILNHLPQLQHLNENLLLELNDRIENWDKVQKIADIIVKMGPFLKLYSWYIHDFEYNLSLLEDSKKKYPLFAQVVKDFEASARCKRLALNHYMLKPIQRIPQYRLLLQEYLHHLPEEHVDYQDTLAALQIVSEVATHANDSMKHGDNAQKLISIQNSILGHKEIIKPGRLFVKEGELMKLSRKGMQPRWFVLFNDLLLYLTPVQQGLYRVNHELPLTGMKVAIPIQQDYQNEFSIISVARSFTLATKSPEERQEWIVALTKAIEENASKRSTFTNVRLQQKAQEKTSEDDESDFVLGRKAPVWIPDARVTMCQLCTSEFTVTFRRHHCRACGKVVCSICSSNRISLPYLGNRIARVCDDCHSKLGQGSGTCTESADTDSENQQIAVKPHLRTEHRHIKKNKRNLPSVLKEVCANDQGSTISGYLHRKTGKSWKRDWFVLKDKVLYEYKASEDVAALKSLPLLGYQIEPFSEAFENIDPSLLFQLTHPGQAPILFYADTVGATERWISALKEGSVLE